MKKLWICYECQIYEDCRQGEQERVHAVEHASVSRHDVSRIFDFDAPLEHGFDQVAETAEQYHDARYGCRMGDRDALDAGSHQQACHNGEYASADGSFPGFFRGDAGKQFVPAQGDADKVGKRVIESHQQEREENDIRLPVSAAHIREIHQQGEGE